MTASFVMRFFYIYRVVQLLKILIQAGLWLFCNKIHLKNKSLFKIKGPLLIIANHPNSFLDALIIGSYYKRRVFFLARGDVFKKPIHRFLLESLNVIPVYRQREGKEYLHLNDFAFSRSIELLSNGNAVLVFIEGVCVNSNELQPFKKGTARILEGIQKLNINPTVHLAGIAFNQFRGIGKIVNLVVTEMTTIPKIENSRDRVLFNQLVFDQLKQNILTPTTPTRFNKNNLFYHIHLPLYNRIKNFVAQKTKNTVFFDSVLFSVLLFAYPLFLFTLFLFLKLLQFPNTIILSILVVLPIMGKRVQEL
jgi:1-acyl-sn-glycerol-3-phosphate acyltransferase